MFVRRDKALLPTADEARPGRPNRPFAVPVGYCGVGGAGVTCPIGVTHAE